MNDTTYDTFEGLKAQFDSLWICPPCSMKTIAKDPTCVYCREENLGVVVPCVIDSTTAEKSSA